MIKENRGTGRTTKLLENAPEGAVFIWCNWHLDYPKGLAKKIGRKDIKIVSPDWLTPCNYMGITFTGVILDHATKLSLKQREELLKIQPGIRTRK